MSEDYARISAWALDFCRALYARPRWIQLLIFFLLGKYGRRELAGLCGWMNHYGDDPKWEYNLQDCEYQHNDPVWKL